jgi:hypothetical protein
MSAFDYDAEAELFPGRVPGLRSVGYKRFTRAADAIRFAMEHLAPRALAGTCLEVGEERFHAGEIRRLYENADYPLERRLSDINSLTGSALDDDLTPQASRNVARRKRP